MIYYNNTYANKESIGRGIQPKGDDWILCLICGESFGRLGAHINEKHGITAKQYKDMFGLMRKQNLECENVRKSKSQSAKTNGSSDLVKKVGENTRFKKGIQSPKKGIYSEQEKIARNKNDR